MAQPNKPHSHLYQPDKQAWLKHFMASASGEGTGRAVSRGFNVLKGTHPTSSRETTQTVQLVTEAAQGSQIAKSEIRQEEQELKQPSSATGTAPTRAYRRAPPSKRKKAKVVKSQDPDIFHQ